MYREREEIEEKKEEVKVAKALTLLLLFCAALMDVRYYLTGESGALFLALVALGTAFLGIVQIRREVREIREAKQGVSS